jgi:hypothetical protein
MHGRSGNIRKILVVSAEGRGQAVAYLESNYYYHYFIFILLQMGSYPVAVVQALCYKPEGRGFDSR